MIWKDEDYIHYFYKIINLIDGRYYYGIHSLLKSENKDPLIDGYWGSGIEITEDIKKFGKENFKKEIIKIFSTRKEVSDMEKSIVTLDEINKTECYNRIPGGDTYRESMLGRVVCRPKNNLDKIVILSKEDYYNNKDKYVPVTHAKKYLEGYKAKLSEIDGTKRYKRNRVNYIKTQKIDETDTKYSRVRWFINKNTLELKKFIGHEEPNDLYVVWFPSYFFDKINNKFITREYFEDLYKNTPNISKISKSIGVGEKSLRSLKKFYESKGLDLSKYQKKQVKSTGFSGKRIVNNEVEELVINESELDNYIRKGYKLGKLKLLSRQDIINYYTLGNNFKNCAKKYSTTLEKIKEILKIDNTFEIRNYHNSNGKRIRLLVNKEYHEKLIKNGWKPGIK